MKATGIVRRIDDLGRIVIPKEIRRVLRIRESDPLEIYTEQDGSIVLRKYSTIADMGNFAKPYAESLAQASGHMALIADRDQFIAAAGNGNRQLCGKALSREMEEKMTARETVCASKGDRQYIPVTEDETEGYQHEVMTPILAQGDIIGAVVLLSNDKNSPMSEVEMKLAQSAAGFLGRQVEQ